MKYLQFLYPITVLIYAMIALFIDDISLYEYGILVTLTLIYSILIEVKEKLNN